jgi:hypothetical protein
MPKPLDETFSISLHEGKYKVSHTNGTNFHALRHGQPWRDLTGDGLLLAMVQRIEELENRLATVHAQEPLVFAFETEPEQVVGCSHTEHSAGMVSFIRMPAKGERLW